MKPKRDEVIYKIVGFKKKANKDFIEGIEYAKGIPKSQKITVARWFGWDKSFWIQITGLSSNSVVVDSGVIEQLAEEIKRLKKKGLKRDALDKLFVINNPKDILR